MGVTYWIALAAKSGFVAFIAWFTKEATTFVIHKFYEKRPPPSPDPGVREYVRQQQDIANFNFLGENRHSLTDRLRARAIPNQRLVEAFGIDSSFTTTDPTIHSNFLQSARHAMGKMSTEKWIDMFNVAQTALNQTVAHIAPSRQQALPLARLARVFVFTSILHVFFDVQPDAIDIDDAVRATEAINTLWVQSKDGGQPAPRRESQEQLLAALRRLLPACFPCEPRGNPLNTIIPAYETMWRAVLLAFVCAGFRGVDRATARQFRDVVAGVPACFGWEPKKELEDVALSFAKEVLRLYPPTKRIYRAEPAQGTSESHTILSADIEKCHRDPSIWGPDALRFRPSRFRKKDLADALHPPFTADMRRTYMPFGVGPHVCPAASAASGFGFRAIVVLMVVLARRLGTKESGAIVHFGDKDLENDLDALLPSGRQDMEDWTLGLGDTE
ncbi:cytochrome P450 [Hypoxylon crocopeplum]|nr:cytochrome P450 [Hypoxylon crocopeplum]